MQMLLAQSEGLAEWAQSIMLWLMGFFGTGAQEWFRGLSADGQGALLIVTVLLAVVALVLVIVLGVRLIGALRVFLMYLVYGAGWNRTGLTKSQLQAKLDEIGEQMEERLQERIDEMLPADLTEIVKAANEEELDDSTIRNLVADFWASKTGKDFLTGQIAAAIEGQGRTLIADIDLSPPENMIDVAIADFWQSERGQEMLRSLVANGSSDLDLSEITDLEPPAGLVRAAVVDYWSGDRGTQSIEYQVQNAAGSDEITAQVREIADRAMSRELANKSSAVRRLITVAAATKLDDRATQITEAELPREVVGELKDVWADAIRDQAAKLKFELTPEHEAEFQTVFEKQVARLVNFITENGRASGDTPKWMKDACDDFQRAVTRGVATGAQAGATAAASDVAALVYAETRNRFDGRPRSEHEHETAGALAS